MKNLGFSSRRDGMGMAVAGASVETAPDPDAIVSRLTALEASAVVTSIGHTPLARLRRLERHIGLPDTIELHLKTEWVNPGGSIKDRPALSIVKAAIAAGELGAGQALLDSTSGNTGIAYAMLGAA